MTTQYRHPETDDICNTGRWCTECCEFIPSELGTSRTREIGYVVYHVCGPQVLPAMGRARRGKCRPELTD